MKIHFINKYTLKTYCQNKSWFVEVADKHENVTCKICKECHEVQIGKRDELSFGGNYSTNNQVRENNGSKK